MKKAEKEMIEAVTTFLKDKYGEIKPEWNIVLMALKDTIHRYSQIKKEIDKSGIYDGSVKNPLLSTEKDCLATILKLTQKIGCTPWDFAKLNKAESQLGVEDDTEDFIDSLIN